jgi:hypothetical protein
MLTNNNKYYDSTINKKEIDNHIIIGLSAHNSKQNNGDVQLWCKP